MLIAGVIAGLVNASGLLVKPGSKLESFKKFIDTITVPFGMACVVLAFVNIFSFFWITPYPLITWLVVMINAAIILKDFLTERLNIQQGPLLTVMDTLVKYKTAAGMTLLVICVIKVIMLVSPLFEAILL